MQWIVETTKTATEYVARKAHLTVKAPPRCLHCGRAGTLEALGYYERWVRCEVSGGAVEISVRRFLVPAL